jgi:dCTP deaminase
MILSNVELHKALDSGRLVIRPEPSPRFPSKDQEDCPYDTHAVDLRLGPKISVPKALPVAVDLTQKGSLSEFITQNSEEIVLAKDRGHRLDQGQFVLASTREYLMLPIDHPENLASQVCLGARIEGKSSRARCGLLVHFTAPTVHPGFEGNLTLEMINLGKHPFMLCLDMPIAQLIVEEVKGIPRANPSQFQGQTTPAGLKA